MDQKVKDLLGIGIGIAVLFVVLNALTALFSGQLGSNWTSAITEASAFIEPVLVIAMAGLALTVYEKYTA